MVSRGVVNHFVKVELIGVQKLLDPPDGHHHLDERGEKKRELPQRVLYQIEQNKHCECGGQIDVVTGAYVGGEYH